MENKEDYVGYEDQELCNRYYKEAEAISEITLKQYNFIIRF